MLGAPGGEIPPGDSMPAGCHWITALRKATLRRVMEQQNVPWSLFDEPDWAEVESEDFSGERLTRCRNPLQADKQAHTREAWLQKTEQKRDPLVAATPRARRPWRGTDRMALRAGGLLAKYQMTPYFDVPITETTFTYPRQEAVL